LVINALLAGEFIVKKAPKAKITIAIKNLYIT
jgi:hypothetical protein